MKMHDMSNAAWIIFCMVFMLAGLSACNAIAPGMHMDEKYIPGPDTSSRATPVIKVITTQLLQSEKEMRDKQPSQDISALLVASEPYRIGNGDVLSIVVWGHPELNGSIAFSQIAQGLTGAENAIAALPAPGFIVDQDGFVQFPLIGPMKFAGLTELQARQELMNKLAHYIKNPDITLRIQAYRNKRIYMDGEVKTPGTLSIDDIPMTLLEALNRSGGILPTGDQSMVRVVRDGVTYNISLTQLIRKGINPANILLSHGDIVRVLSREESKVFVLGEVIFPKALTMHNGQLSLNEALGEAGGINPLSGGRQVYVVRNGASDEPIVYYLDAASPVSLAMAENFPLKSRDIVYVDTAPLATWNRIVTLILPTALSAAVSAATTYQATKD